MSDFLTIKEVCDLLKIGERTAYDLCREGKLGGAAKVGNQWRVNREELMTWLKTGGDAGRRTPTADDALVEGRRGKPGNENE